MAAPARAQQDSQNGSSSSSSSDNPASDTSRPTPPPRIAQPEAGGSAVTLETSEPLFYIAAALNACGYDDDLAASAPIRLKIRDEINAELRVSADARNSRDALCAYVREHTLNDRGLNLAQYISLALYLSPPPALTPTVSQLDLPPDSTQVVNILPLLRTFGEDVHLNALWVTHRADYEALTARLHDPLTRVVLNTNIYLGMPVSSYDGRRFLVLLEPMLAPSATNARIYGSDYIVVVSPAGDPLGAVHMNEIRHTYLHYEIEPLVYSRASAMDRLMPLLKTVQDAPLEFVYKSNISSLITECLIKAVEAHIMDVGIAKPKRPAGVGQRPADFARYDSELSAYNRQAELVRRKAVDLDMHQGWVLVGYFYDKLGLMGKESVSLKEDIGEMVYGMDVGREIHSAQQIVFLPEGSTDVVRRAPRQLTGIQLGEMKMLKGDLDGAESIAKAALADPKGDHAQAHYLMARLDLMQRNPDAAISDFQATLASSKDPRTLAWSHIYLGRLYDVTADRQKALAEYQAALTVRDGQPDTKTAAEQGLKQPFSTPGMKQSTADQPDDDAPLDPSGKAEKDAYRPPPPK
jgi:tetratricopeptide (TPR) repeat protein